MRSNQVQRGQQQWDGKEEPDAHINSVKADSTELIIYLRNSSGGGLMTSHAHGCALWA